MISGELIRQWKAHDKEICKIIFDHDSNFLWSCSIDSSIKIWDTNSNNINPNPLRIFNHHQACAYDLLLVKNLNVMISSSYDKFVNFYQRNNLDIKPIRINTYHGNFCLFHVDQFNELIIGCYQILLIYDINNKQQKQQLEHHTGWITCIEYDYQNNKLFTGSFDKTINVYLRKSQYEYLLSIKEHQGLIYSILIWNDYLITGGDDSHLYIHYKNNHQLLAKVNTKNTVRQIKLLNNKFYIANFNQISMIELPFEFIKQIERNQQDNNQQSKQNGFIQYENQLKEEQQNSEKINELQNQLERVNQQLEQQQNGNNNLKKQIEEYKQIQIEDRKNNEQILNRIQEQENRMNQIMNQLSEIQQKYQEEKEQTQEIQKQQTDQIQKLTQQFNQSQQQQEESKNLIQKLTNSFNISNQKITLLEKQLLQLQQNNQSLLNKITEIETNQIQLKKLVIENVQKIISQNQLEKKQFEFNQKSNMQIKFQIESFLKKENSIKKEKIYQYKKLQEEIQEIDERNEKKDLIKQGNKMSFDQIKDYSTDQIILLNLKVNKLQDIVLKLVNDKYGDQIIQQIQDNSQNSITKFTQQIQFISIFWKIIFDLYQIFTQQNFRNDFLLSQLIWNYDLIKQNFNMK